jgi:hypothetical protein
MGFIKSTIYKMEDLVCNESKKTLMNAIEKLNITIKNFDELERFSEVLVEKFNRTEGMCKPSNDSNDIIITPILGIVESFYVINDKLDILLNKIGNNINKVVNMID